MEEEAINAFAWAGLGGRRLAGEGGLQPWRRAAFRGINGLLSQAGQFGPDLAVVRPPSRRLRSNKDGRRLQAARRGELLSGQAGVREPQAIDAHQRALALDPNDALAAFNLGAHTGTMATLSRLHKSGRLRSPGFRITSLPPGSGRTCQSCCERVHVCEDYREEVS